MGKFDSTNLQLHQSQQHPTSSTHFFCQRCSLGFSRFANHFSFKCVFVLILSLCLLVSGIFWIFPLSKPKQLNSFDAAESIKLSATVQASFCLQKPVSQLIPNIGRLEYDIFEEIGVPDTKVVILSLHESGSSNCTEVVFGVLSNPIVDVPINIVPLSILRSSLVELFLKECNLTLTNSTFGQPSEFEILKFPGGVTVIPLQYASIWQIQQILFNFTLNNSISEILENLAELKDQLKSGLHLKPYENVVVQLTNTAGSTVDPPVTVQASVITDLGNLLPQRLKQLAQTITNSPARNLGLDNTIFGKVKSVILSSYLKGTLHEAPPTPSPAPSPELNDCAEPPVSPSSPPSSSPSPVPSAQFGDRSPNSPYDGPCHSLPPVNSPAPSTVAHPPHPCPDRGYGIPPTSGSPSPHPNPAPYFQPVGSPSYPMSPGPSPLLESEIAPSAMAPSPLSSTPGPHHAEVWLLGLSGILIFYVLVILH